MTRTLLLCATTALVAATFTILLVQHGNLARAADAANLVPPCPHAGFGADGNMGPLFCVIDNPVALRYFAPMGKRTFALGPDATPGEVTSALVADFKHGGTLPILCSIYQLASWKNHWRFGMSIAYGVSQGLHAVAGWCSEPSVSVQ
jgi:hypothetical protein